MNKLTPISFSYEKELTRRLGLGTGRTNGCEVVPSTPTIWNKIKVTDSQKKTLTLKQKTILEGKIPNEKLRPYQEEDIRFLTVKHNAACFNEQRTGKTPTALQTMKYKGVTKLLIIAPASTLYNWAKECKEWYYKTEEPIVVDGPKSKREKQIQSWTRGPLIISYECLREVQRTKKNKYGEIEELEITGDLSLIKKHKDIQGIILDEAHRIKNHQSKQAEALFSLHKIPHKLALTGTPAPGKQHEIYSILHWLYPNIFTGYWRFIDYYFTQYEEYNANGKYKVIGTFKPGKAQELQEFLDVISTNRKRKDVMQWLPEKERTLVSLPQTQEQQKYIKELKEHFEITGTDINAENILAQLMKTRQILLAPELLELKGKSPKIEWIKQYIKDYPEKQILIFSNFTKWLKLLAKEIHSENNLIIGETTKEKRETLKNKFQAGEIQILLINIKAGKEGITLDNADTAIFTDKYPPVGDILQAEDRFVATSQEKLNRGHEIIDLCMEKSYEENILRLLKTNEKEIDIINDYVKYMSE